MSGIKFYLNFQQILSAKRALRVFNANVLMSKNIVCLLHRPKNCILITIN